MRIYANTNTIAASLAGGAVTVAGPEKLAGRADFSRRSVAGEDAGVGGGARGNTNRRHIGDASVAAGADPACSRVAIWDTCARCVTSPSFSVAGLA